MEFYTPLIRGDILPLNEGMCLRRSMNAFIKIRKSIDETKTLTPEILNLEHLNCKVIEHKEVLPSQLSLN